MFLAGRTPAIVSSPDEFSRIVGELERAGYKRHLGPRVQRWTELGAWRREISPGRQIHVQCLSTGGPEEERLLEWFAHTEPSGWGVRHLWAALTDGVSYQHGSRILREDVGSLLRVVPSRRRRRSA